MDKITLELYQVMKRGNPLAARVMADVITGRVTDETIQTARQIEIDDPETWQANDWLKIIGGAAEPYDHKWLQTYAREMMEDEANE